MADGKYFSTTKKGEIHELKEELRALDRPKKKEAVKKVIAAMTVGKDVSMLFPDVVNCMQTDDLELKKLVYLYLINYAKTQPDLAIMAVNTFVKDSKDPNPLIRALAVRTMGCIRVDKITEYLCDPLQAALKDEDPYVRKTAAVCVAKLYDINPELVDDRGFLDQLREMLSDANPMVVANALAALQEIQEISGKDMLQLTQHTLNKLLTALNDCTEWGQVFILDSLAQYETRDTRDAEKIAERVLPRLQHVNSAVVLSAVKVIMRMMDVCQNEDLIKAWCRKMAPPLVTLLGAEPEIQYVALRNINLIVQKRPYILSNEVKVFFCKYNDPIYVKMEKLEIMIRLATDKNIDQVLLEFKEYAQEVDVDFVRKAVRAMGRCAVSIEGAAKKCINVLLELIQTKVNYVVQEAVIVIKDIFRRYPNRYEDIIGTLCDNLDSLDEPEAKASMVWIIGEYAERIDNADELLEMFLDTFPEETAMVQLQLLTATVKLFLKKPTESAQKMISAVLSCATNETDNPDLRDRAFIYWRLLSTDPEAAKEVVLAQKPVITDDTGALDPLLLDKLLRQIATLASIYHKPPEMFVSRQRLAVQRAADLEGHKFEDEDISPVAMDPAPASGPSSAGPSAPAPAPQPVADLLGGDLDEPPSSGPGAAGSTGQGGLDDLLGGLSIGGSGSGSAGGSQLPVLFSDPAKGVTISGCIARQAGAVVYALVIANSSHQPLDGLMLQTNRSSFGLSPANVVLQVAPIEPNSSARLLVPMAVDPAKLLPGLVSPKLELAMKTNQAGVIYFADNVPLLALLDEGGTIEGQAFLSAWKALPPESQSKLSVAVSSVEAAKQKLQAANMFVLAHRPVPGTTQEALYLTAKVAAINTQVLLELRMSAGYPGVDVSFKSERADLAAMTFDAVAKVLS